MNNTSCYVNGNYCEKPELIAPGTNYIMYWYPEWSGNHFLAYGSSFSAPMVAGISAYLMQANATLKTKPVAIKAILVASCDRKVLDSDGIIQSETLGGLTDQQGAGVVNATKALNIVSNLDFLNGSVSDLSSGSYFECSAAAMSSTSRKSFALAWEANIGDMTNHTVPTYVTFMPNFDFRVRTTSSQTIIGASSKANSSVEVVNLSSTATNFVMRVVNNTAMPDQTIEYALAWCEQ